MDQDRRIGSESLVKRAKHYYETISKSQPTHHRLETVVSDVTLLRLECSLQLQSEGDTGDGEAGPGAQAVQRGFHPAGVNLKQGIRQGSAGALKCNVTAYLYLQSLSVTTNVYNRAAL